MKTFTRVALTGVGVSLIAFVSCSKNEYEDPDVKKPKQTECDIASFSQQYSGGDGSYVFKKTYDLSGRKLSRIDAGLYSGGVIWDTVHLNLNYDYNKIYFISAENSSDTGLVLHMDNAGRVLRADVGQIIDNGFGPQEFSYKNGKLDLINIQNDGMRVWFRYDGHGNNTQIVTDSAEGVARINHVFEYDTKKKGQRHAYFDEARGFSFNVLTILHAAGFFPELNPVHTRTRSTVHWGSYQAYDFVQFDHTFDKDGRLLQYKTASPGNHSPVATYTISYNCAKNNSEPLLTMAQ